MAYLGQHILKPFSVKIDPATHGKLHYIAEYEGRSATSQIIYLLRQFIAAYESEHGEIPLPEDVQQAQDALLKAREASRKK